MSNLCPACSAPLVAIEYQGVELDHCLECKGTWLDAGELEQIARLAGVPEQGPITRQIETSDAKRKLERECPRCGKRLAMITVEVEAGKIEIDRCPRGDGFWFDRGELVLLIGAPASDAADQAIRSFLADLFHHELEDVTKGE